METAFLDNMTSDPQETAWYTQIQLSDKETLFKLDTGAEVTAISEKTHQDLGKPKLHTPDKALFGPSQQPLHVEGQFEGTLTHNHRSSVQPVFVVKGLKTNLLGLPAITALNLAARINSAEIGIDGNIHTKFPQVFEGLGNLGEEFHIKLKPDATPHALFTPRHVPLPLRPKVEQELKKMESMEVISKVDEPTEWCAGMVVVPKKSGKICICVDLKPLNESVLREVHPLPKVDETRAQLTGARVFSKLDANSGFWQIPLAKSSRHLTTVITPFGRYCFNKLPFGISSAPEHFQKRMMSQILSGIDGVVCHGRDEKEHTDRLNKVLQRIQSAGATLNPAKCEFQKTKLKFLGHLIDEEGIKVDPEKTIAIEKMATPTNVPELRRFMGMVNQLGKFSSNLAELTQPLRKLLSKNQTWIWGSAQEQAFKRVKEELSRPTTLTLYDPAAETTVSAVHMAWEWYYCRRRERCGNQWHMLRILCQKPNDAMPR
jgi:hypothetical protein